MITGNPPATSATISGLTNGDELHVHRDRHQRRGHRPGLGPVQRGDARRRRPRPRHPTGVTATAGNGSANVSWTAPSNGGSAITSYTVTPYLSGVAQTPTTVTGAPPATTATVTGLTNGQPYTFTVTATNAIGSGPASSASNAVTPSAVSGTGLRPAGKHARARR